MLCYRCNKYKSFLQYIILSATDDSHSRKIFILDSTTFINTGEHLSTESYNRKTQTQVIRIEHIWYTAEIHFTAWF